MKGYSAKKFNLCHKQLAKVTFRVKAWMPMSTQQMVLCKSYNFFVNTDDVIEGNERGNNSGTVQESRQPTSCWLTAETVSGPDYQTAAT